MKTVDVPDESLHLPDTELATAARVLAADAEAEFIYNHSVRSYLFARAAAAAQGMQPGIDYDDELVFLSCILHDLGATDYANGDQRFEVDGADAAASFLRSRDVDPSRVTPVWNAIALHTSNGLAHRFGPTEAVTQLGISIDIIGYRREMLPEGFAQLVHAMWPRHDLGYALTYALAGQVQSNPAKGGPLTFPGELHQLIYAPDSPVTFLDLVDAAGWGDRPTSTANVP